MSHPVLDCTGFGTRHKGHNRLNRKVTAQSVQEHNLYKNTPRVIDFHVASPSPQRTARPLITRLPRVLVLRLTSTSLNVQTDSVDPRTATARGSRPIGCVESRGEHCVYYPRRSGCLISHEVTVIVEYEGSQCIGTFVNKYMVEVLRTGCTRARPGRSTSPFCTQMLQWPMTPTCNARVS